MDDKEKIATLFEQGRWQSKENHEIKTDIKEIKKDVKSLLEFRWKLYGVNAAISAISAGTVAIAIEILRGKS